MLDDIAPLASADTRKWTMGHHRWWDGQPAADRTTALPKTNGRLTIGAEAIIIISAAVAAALRAAAILVPAALADVELKSSLDRAGVVLGKFYDVAVTQEIILRHRAQQEGTSFDRNTLIPLPRGCRLPFQMPIPPSLYQIFATSPPTPH